MRNLRYLLLAFLLLGGQYALLVHVTNHIDESNPDHACEVCLHNAGLDSGIASAVVQIASPVMVEAPLPEYHHFLSFAAERLFDARGPPLSLSV